MRFSQLLGNKVSSLQVLVPDLSVGMKKVLQTLIRKVTLLFVVLGYFQEVTVRIMMT